MDPLSKSERIATVSAAVASDLNDELTILLSSIQLAIRVIRPGDPAFQRLLEIQSAALRASWLVSNLLTYSTRNGARRTAATAAALTSTL